MKDSDPIIEIGNAVYEIKSSPGNKYLNHSTLKAGFHKARKLLAEKYWIKRYIFLFPVNEVGEETEVILEKFKLESKSTGVEIEWLDYEDLENIGKLIDLKTEDDYVRFIEKNTEIVSYIRRKIQ